jgi:hypothetical protein
MVIEAVYAASIVLMFAGFLIACRRSFKVIE